LAYTALILTDANRSTWKTEARTKLIGKPDDTRAVPDATLTSLLGETERDIKKRLTDSDLTYSALTGDDKEYMIDATICLLCAKLVTPLRAQIAKTEKFDIISETKDLNFDKLEADLYASVETFLGEIAGYSATVTTICGVISPSEPMFEDLE
jgi:hypothetical protein